MKKILASKHTFDTLKLPPYVRKNEKSLDIMGIPVFESPIFPYEISYPACDTDTHEEVKILSGEWCHGIIINDPIEWPEPEIEYSYEQEEDKIRFTASMIFGVPYMGLNEPL